MQQQQQLAGKIGGFQPGRVCSIDPHFTEHGIFERYVEREKSFLVIPQ